MNRGNLLAVKKRERVAVPQHKYAAMAMNPHASTPGDEVAGWSFAQPYEKGNRIPEQINGESLAETLAKTCLANDACQPRWQCEKVTASLSAMNASCRAAATDAAMMAGLPPHSPK